MKKYLRILRFGKSYIKYILLVILLTLIYITFNTSSYWFSASFFKQLFTEEQIEVSSQPEQPLGPLQDMSIDKRIKEKLQSYTDRLILGESKKETLLRVCLIIFFSFLIKNIIAYFNGILRGFIELGIITDIRNKIFSHLITLPIKYFHEKKSGEMVSILINDVGAINSTITSSFRDIMLVPMEIVVHFVILLILSPKLTLLIVILIPLFAFILAKIGSSIRRKSKRTLTGISNVISHIQEVIPNIKIIKAYVAEQKENQLFRNLNHIFYRLSFRQKKLQNLTSPVNEVIGAGLGAYILWYGGNQVFSMGTLSADEFIKYLVILFAMFQPLKKLSGLNNTIQMGLAAGERVFLILDQIPEEDTGTEQVPGFKESIQLKDVNFRYGEDQQLVLRNINLTIKKGEIVAFVGPSGAGKSTLVNLIPRFYHVKDGEILLDGINIENIKLASLRSLLGIVTQETILFNSSISDNIAYGSNNMIQEDILKAAEAAKVDEFALATQNGFDTIVGERGVKVSGGQKQRIAIARAILKNPPILILDEATSSLDPDSERFVQEAIEKLMKNRTVLVIAHRLSTIIHADKIVVMNKGEIFDIGSHKELLDSCELYRHLYEIQFRDEENNKAKVL